MEIVKGMSSNHNTLQHFENQINNQNNYMSGWMAIVLFANLQLFTST
jgi:hypothetical protein